MATLDAFPTPSPGTSVARTAYPTTSPGASNVPVVWPTAEETGGIPVQGTAYEVNRDAGKPTDVAVDKVGVAWVAVGKRARNSETAPSKGEVVTLSAEGKPLKVYTLDGNPQRIEAAKDGGVWVLMDARTTNAGMSPTMGLVRLGADGKLLSRLDLSTGGSYNSDTAVMVPDAAGNLWVKVGANNGQTLHRIGAGGGLLGTYTLPTTTGSTYPGGLGVDKDNKALIADYAGKQIVCVGTNLQKDVSFPAAVDNNGAFQVQGSQEKIWVGFTSELQLWTLGGTKISSTRTGFPINETAADGAGGMWVLGVSGGYQSYSGSVVHYDKVGVAEASYAVGSDPRGFGVGGDGAIWAANYDAGTVTRVGTR